LERYEWPGLAKESCLAPLLPEAAQIVRQGSDLFIEWVKFEAGFGDEEGVVEAVGLVEKVRVVEDSFGAPGAKCEGLQTGEVGFF
jgi:hypothetical protein